MKKIEILQKLKCDTEKKRNRKLCCLIMPSLSVGKKTKQNKTELSLFQKNRDSQATSAIINKVNKITSSMSSSTNITGFANVKMMCRISCIFRKSVSSLLIGEEQLINSDSM